MKLINSADFPGGELRDLDCCEKERRLVRRVIKKVAERRDAALRYYTRLWDRVKVTEFRVPAAEMSAACARLEPGLLSALQACAANIEAFARAQLAALRPCSLETRPGVFCASELRPIERVGIYAPGGRHPLFSSVLMGVIPARVAGVNRVVLCSPPGPAGRPADPVLAAAALAGADEVYSLGGIQAVAALALGTESLPRVDKIAGPGNLWVTLAKQELSHLVGIDLLAGPSEIMVMADSSADPEILAADLLSQCEHDPLARAFLLSDDRALLENTMAACERQLADLATATTARQALTDNSLAILVSDWSEAVGLADRIAPEHLELIGPRAEALAGQINNCGTLFIGHWAPEALGDYSSGLNHVLPTSGGARHGNGLGVADFIRQQTRLQVTRAAFPDIAAPALVMARAEGLAAHARSLELRLP